MVEVDNKLFMLGFLYDYAPADPVRFGPVSGRTVDKVQRKFELHNEHTITVTALAEVDSELEPQQLTVNLNKVSGIVAVDVTGTQAEYDPERWS